MALGYHARSTHSHSSVHHTWEPDTGQGMD